MRACIALLSAVLVCVVGCGGHGSEPPRVQIPALESGGSGCADPNPPATPPVTGPLRTVLAGHRFVRTWTLDHGGLRVSPLPRATRARLSYAQARCLLLSARSAENFPILPDAEHFGFSLGLGVVSVRSGIAPVVVGTSTGATSPPPARLPHREPAWIAVVHPTVAANCPSVTPGHASPHPRPGPGVTGYQVLILAGAGHDGSLYVARAPAVCTSGVQAAAFGRLVAQVSLPWRLVRRSATAATLSVAPRRCDQVEDFARLTGNVVTAAVSRPVASCAQGPSLWIRLQAAGAGRVLPRTLRPAPVGALDVPEHY